MTTPGESGTPTALDLLFGPGTDAAETGCQSLIRVISTSGTRPR